MRHIIENEFEPARIGRGQDVHTAERPLDDIDTAAAEWVARLGGAPLSPVERRDLDRWLGEDPRHRAAFDEARGVWAKMGLVRLGAELAMPPEWRRATRPVTPAWLRAAAAAVLLALSVAGGATLWFGDPRVVLTADHHTAPGEQKTVTLEDGSVVRLGPATAIAVDYSDAARRIKLLGGIAEFVPVPLAESGNRPFVVLAANGTARALGTRFTVNRMPHAVEVAVLEHDVEVRPGGGGGASPPVVLSPGQSIRYSEAGVGAVEEVGLDTAISWRHGSLVFDHRPLGDVVAELNRRRYGTIVIADRGLASRTVSGVFEAGEPEAAFATIVETLRIRAASLSPLVTVLY